MKIFVYCIDYLKYGASIKKALAAMGYDVDLFITKTFVSKKLSLGDYAKYKLNKKQFIQNFVEQERQEVLQAISKSQPDILLCVNTNWGTERIEEKFMYGLRHLEKRPKLIYWMIDSIKKCDFSPQHLDLFDNLFVFEKADIPYIKEKYGRESSYLPLGADYDIYCSKPRELNYKYDVCFVGQAYEERCIFLEKIAKYCVEAHLRFIVIGRYWHSNDKIRQMWKGYKFRRKYPYLYKVANNDIISPEAVAKLYATSKINLNIHDARHKGANPRTFEIMGNGNFQLCDYREQADDLGLYDGENIVFYRDVDDCIAKINQYLQAEQIREKIALAGREAVLKKFTVEKFLIKYFSFELKRV